MNCLPATLFNFAFEALLAKSFKQDQGDAIGEVEGAGFGIEHGNANPTVAVIAQQLFGQACGLPAKNQIIIGYEIGIRVEKGALGFDKPEARSGGELFMESGPIGPAMPLDVLPVIHSGALELGVVESKAERFDQVESSPGSCAQPGHIACVWRNLRFK